MADVDDYEPTDEEFGDWDEEAEDAAIKEVAASSAFRIRYVIRGLRLLVKTSGGTLYRLPLDISTDDFSKLQAAGSDADTIEVLRGIYRAIDPERAEQLSREPIPVVTKIMTLYGKTIAKVQAATLGE